MADALSGVPTSTVEASAVRRSPAWRRTMTTPRPLAPLLLLFAAACGERASDAKLVRIGHFPNVTHAQGLVGQATTREKKGWFEERLGPGGEVEWPPYNAGPGEVVAGAAGSR